jgi:hypothetical protein
MKNKIAAIAVCGCTLLASTIAHATCQWTFVNGRQQQICESTIDLPAIRPPAIAPIAPPSIAPIQAPVIPPLGASSCEQAQVWNGSSYQWRTLCQ